jgi:four helix bundle protein
MDNVILSYQDLDVWRLGIDLTLRIYEVASHLPASERYELSSQIRRAVVSVPSNVAEGHARRRPKPYLNHVEISLGSLAELVTCLVIARRLEYITQSQLDAVMSETDRVGQMLHGLGRSLERRIKSQASALRLCAFLGGLVAVVGVLA